MATRIGVDIGGTFTDLIYYDDVSGESLVAKVPTTPDNPDEGVVNAIRHGCRDDTTKRITVELGLEPPEKPVELVVRVIDPGEGFDPDDVADPLAEENLLKPTGRGIFFMRRMMDDVTLRRPPEGGMEVRMVKRLRPAV